MALHPDVSQVLQLEAMDSSTRLITRRIHRLSKRITEIEASLACYSRALAQAKADVEQNNAALRYFQSQADARRKKISKLIQGQVVCARSNEHTPTVAQEIECCRDAIDTLTRAGHGRIAESKKLQQTVSVADAELKREKAKAVEDLRLAKARIEAACKERDQSIADRDALAVKMSYAILCVYERIHKARGVATTVVNRGRCGSCHARLSFRLLLDLYQHGQGLLTCESCGLIVYRSESGGGRIQGLPRDLSSIRQQVRWALESGTLARVSHSRDCLICGVPIRSNERHFAGNSGGNLVVWACWACGTSIYQAKRYVARYSEYLVDGRDSDDTDDYDQGVGDDWNQYDYEVDSGYRDDWDYYE